MSAAVLERPPTAERTGAAPARRAVLRWAWRLFGREWRQQLLVLALVTVAVAATILGAAVATNSPPPAGAGFGSATHLVTLPGNDPHLTADVARIRQRFGAVDVIENRQVATGETNGAQLRAQDPQGRYGQPMLALVTGRFPRGAGEIALAGPLASVLGLHAGDSWSFDGRAARIVGVVENPQNLLDTFALLAPGQLDHPGRVTVLFDATARQLAGFRFPQKARPVTPQASNGISPAFIVLAVAIIGLIFVGLVASAGFTVLAQRRLRGLGMLSSLGATDRNVRLVMVANGFLLGAAGALAGAVIGLGIWIGYAPHLSVSAHHRVHWTSLPWWLVAAAMLLAVLTTTLASRRPARAVAELPVVAALSGRPAPPKAVHRSALPGAGLLVVGTLGLAFCGGWGTHGGKDTLFELGGLLASAAGLLLLAPLGVSMLGPAARRAPLAIRIALRDLARYRARSGAALAAASFAVLIAMLITLITTGRFADPVDYFGPNLAANQLLISPGARTGPVEQRSGVESITASLGSHDVLALDATDAFLVRRQTHVGSNATIYVATPTLLAHYRIDPRLIRADTVMITSRPGLQASSGLQLLHGFSAAGPDAQAIDDPPIQTFSELPTDTAAPNLLITEQAAARLKMKITSPGGWLLTAPHALTAAQVNTARQAALGAGLTIESKNDAPSLDQVRGYATAAGILLALGVLAMTIGLIRSETAGDLRTLAAAGARSVTRRTITAATAGALGLLAAVLGTAVAYLASTAFFRTQLSERMSHPPTTDLLLVLVGLPLVATVGGWLFAGRQPAAIGRQPME